MGKSLKKKLYTTGKIGLVTTMALGSSLSTSMSILANDNSNVQNNPIVLAESSLPQSTKYPNAEYEKYSVDELKGMLDTLIKEVEALWKDNGGFDYYKNNVTVNQIIDKTLPKAKQYLEEGNSTAMTFSWRCYEMENAKKSLNSPANILTETIKEIYKLNEEMLGLDESLYTSTTWSAYENMVKEAMTKANGSGTSEDTLKQYIEDIKALKEALVKVDQNLVSLKSLVKECEEISYDNYTRESWQAFGLALSNAQEEIRKGAETIDSVVYAELSTKLNETKEGLEKAQAESVEKGILSAWTDTGSSGLLYENNSLVRGGSLYVSKETVNSDGTSTLEITWENNGRNPANGGMFHNTYYGAKEEYGLRPFTASDWAKNEAWWIEVSGEGTANVENLYLTEDDRESCVKTVKVPAGAKVNLELHSWGNTGSGASSTARTYSFGTYYVSTKATAPEITDITLAENNKSLVYLPVGETLQLQVHDQEGNEIEASLLEYTVSTTKGYINVNDEGLVSAVKEGSVMNDKTQVKVALRSNPSIYTYVNVVVPKAPVIEKVEVATGSTSALLPNYTEGAISDTASKIYYFQFTGNAEWRSDLDNENQYGTNGLPTITWYLDGTKVDEQSFSWMSPQHHDRGIKQPGRQAITISTYGKHEVKAVLEGLDGKTVEKVMNVERTPIWLNTDGSIKKITANSKDVVVPDTVNGLKITALSSKDTEGVLEGVTSLVLPEGITSISDNFFKNATDLTTIEFKGGVPSGNLDFSNTKLSDNGVIVPEGMKDDFLKASENWTAPEGKTWKQILGIADKTELQEFYDDVKDTVFSYPDKSFYQKFVEQLDKAKAVLEDTSATQAEVDKAYQDLQQRYWLNMVNDKVAYYNPSKQGVDGRFDYSDKLTDSILPLVAAFKEGRNDTSIYTDIEEMKTHYNAFLEAEKLIEIAPEDVRGQETGFNVEADNTNNFGKFEITKQEFVEVDGKVKVKVYVTFINDGIDHVTGKEGKKYSVSDLKKASVYVPYESAEGNEITYLRNVQPLNDSYSNGLTGEVTLNLDSVIQLYVEDTYMPGYVKVNKFVAADKSQLQTILKMTKTAIDTEYNYKHDDRWDAFVSSYNKANEVYGNLAATKEEVDEIVNDLTMKYLDIRMETTAPSASFVIDGKDVEIQNGMVLNKAFDLKFNDNGKLFQFVLNGKEFTIDGKEDVVLFDEIKDLLKQGNGEAGKNVLVVRDSVPPIGETYLNETTYTFYVDQTNPEVISIVPNSDGTVRVKFNEPVEIKDENWKKSELQGETDGRFWIGTLTEDKIYSVTAEDAAGNTVTFDVDHKMPTANITYSQTTPTNGEVVVTITLDETAMISSSTENPGWTVSNDGKTFTKVFKENAVEKVRLHDGMDNEVVVEVNVNNIDKNAPKLDAKDVVLTVGDEFDPLKNVTVSDDVSEDMKVKVIYNDVDTTKVGTYTVTYQVRDEAGNETELSISVQVNPKMEVINEAPVITALDKVLNVGDKFDAMEGIVALDKEDGDLTSFVKVLENTVDTSKAGTYKVVYEVVDSAGIKVTKTIHVAVKEKEDKPNVPETKPDEKPGSPTTGVASPLGGFAGMMGMSLAAIGMIFKRKKNDK